MNPIEYFKKFNLEESDVAKFEVQMATNAISLVFSTSFSHNFHLMTPNERNSFERKFKFEDFHKLEFGGIADYARGQPISVHFEGLDSYEEKVGETPELIMYGVKNSTFGNNSKFSAVLSGFGEISFNYSEFTVAFRKVMQKDISASNGKRLYIDLESGRTGDILDLFDTAVFKVGDTVHLRSGGPEMTVKSFNGKKEGRLVHCIWFDNSNRKQSDDFPYDMLEVADRMTESKFTGTH